MWFFGFSAAMRGLSKYVCVFLVTLLNAWLLKYEWVSLGTLLYSGFINEVNPKSSTHLLALSLGILSC